MTVGFVTQYRDVTLTLYTMATSANMVDIVHSLGLPAALEISRAARKSFIRPQEDKLNA